MSNFIMSEYENKQVELIKDWEQQVPGVVSKGVGLLSKPATWLFQQIVPQSAIKAALNAANSAGKKLADESDILRDGKVTTIEDLRTQSLEMSDRLANEVHNWAIGMATVEGGAAGFTGVAGIAADIPAVLTLALRTIHKIGLCYGYRADTKEEQDFVLSILSAAGSNSQKEKTSALLALKSIEVVVAKQTWKAISMKAETQLMGKELGVIAIKNLCKQLGINLTKRKALQAIPGVGAVVGLAVNADFLRDVGYAARRVYQKRWLEENGKWNEESDYKTIEADVIVKQFKENKEIELEENNIIENDNVGKKTLFNETIELGTNTSSKKPKSFLNDFIKGTSKVGKKIITGALDGMAEKYVAKSEEYREKLETNRAKMSEEEYEERIEQLDSAISWSENRLEEKKERTQSNDEFY